MIKNILPLLLLFAVIAMFAGCSDRDIIPPEKHVYITYNILGRGTITGKMHQSVLPGEDGTEVTAVADDGYVFDGWSDGVESPTRQETNVEENIYVVARFVPFTYRVTYSAQTGGSVVGKAEQHVEKGGVCEEVTAVPDEGYVFVSWSDGITDATRKDKEVLQDLEITASFTVKIYTFHYMALGFGRGHIEGPTRQTVSYGEDAEEVVAVAEEGSVFMGWSDGWIYNRRKDVNVRFENTFNFIVAEFTFLYQIDYIAEEGGHIEGLSRQFILHGQDGDEVEVVPDEGYEFVAWSDGRTTAKRQAIEPRENKTYTATFRKRKLWIKYLHEGGSIIGNPTQSVVYGEDAAPVEAVADEGYFFLKWSDGLTDPVRHDTNIRENTTLTAIFRKHILTVEYRTRGYGRVLGKVTQTVPYHGSTTPVEAVPYDAGYYFVEWSDGVKDSVRQDFNLEEDLCVYAIFKSDVVEIMVSYFVMGGGKIIGPNEQLVLRGEDAEQVEAVPDEGYYFVQWTDGNENPVRQDRNILRYTRIGAIFKEIEFDSQNEPLLSIGNNAFAKNGSLTQVQVRRDALVNGTITEIGEKVFDECTNLTLIEVPAGSFGKYKTDKNWERYSSLLSGTL